MSVETIAAIAASCSIVATAVVGGIVKALKAFARIERALAVVDGRSKQLETNGGSSMLDGLRRLETKVDRLGEDVVKVRERTAVLESTANTAARDAAGVRHTLAAIAETLPRRSGDITSPQQERPT